MIFGFEIYVCQMVSLHMHMSNFLKFLEGLCREVEYVSLLRSSKRLTGGFVL